MARELSAAHAGSIRVGDRTVHRMGFGANRVTDTEECRVLLERVVELGVDFIDTADVYQFSASESMLGKTLSDRSSKVLLATKGGIARTADGGSVDGSPDHLREAVEGSLERLRTGCIELYQLHRVDPRVPIEESVGALKELQEAGKIRHLGVSNVTVGELERVRRVATIVTVQNRYNVLDRAQEPVLEYCDQHQIPFIPWTPLHRGNLGTAGPLAEMAARYAVSPHQLALRWLLRRSPVMLPIPGTLSIPHLEQNLAAADIDLRDDDYQQLSRLAPPGGP